MEKIVNLNRFRKDKARAAARARGDENAAKFGRSKSEKALETAQKQKAAQRLDGHLRDISDKDHSG